MERGEGGKERERERDRVGGETLYTQLCFWGSFIDFCTVRNWVAG